MYKLPILFAFFLLLGPLDPAQAQEVYRVVDENGNVTYTDKKPDDDAEPMDLPELNVLEGDEDAPPPIDTTGSESADPESDSRSLNFRIEQPADGATISLANDSLEVIMGIDIDVPETARITLVLDDRQLEPVRSLTTTIDTPPPGEHRLFARLETPSGRVLGTTDPVTFTAVDPSGD